MSSVRVKLHFLCFPVIAKSIGMTYCRQSAIQRSVPVLIAFMHSEMQSHMERIEATPESGCGMLLFFVGIGRHADRETRDANCFCYCLALSIEQCVIHTTCIDSTLISPQHMSLSPTLNFPNSNRTNAQKLYSQQLAYDLIQSFHTITEHT